MNNADQAALSLFVAPDMNALELLASDHAEVADSADLGSVEVFTVRTGEGLMLVIRGAGDQSMIIPCDMFSKLR